MTERPKILIVEDSDDTYEIFSDVLAASGYQVSGAGDGEEGIAAAAQLVPDVILLDLGLPRLDGFAAARRLRSNPGTRHIPIVAITGYVAPDLGQRARAAGCDSVLTKPCHVDRLLDEIARQLRRSRRVLVVEDDLEIRAGLAHVLQGEGHEVALAANGKEALDYLSTHEPPGVILLDLMMPIVDGWQFRAQQRRDPRLAGIPVIVISAMAESRRDLTLEAHAVLGKPLDLPLLLRAVDRCIQVPPL